MTANWIRGSSTWTAPPQSYASEQRTGLMVRIAQLVTSSNEGRVVIAIDGRTASGKTTFADELAGTLNGIGSVVFRASLDDFKNPWRDRHLYDRESGDGYYRNAFNIERIRTDLVGGFRAGLTMLCSIDPLTQTDHSSELVTVPAHAILIVDGVFGLRPDLRDLWNLGVWLDTKPETSERRARARDGDMLERYRLSEQLYITEAEPQKVADIVIDHDDISAPTARIWPHR
jgi:uridine kinase